MIHLARSGAKIGSFSKEEIEEGLRTGKFLPTDLAWEEGMVDWRPLAQVMAEKAAASAPAAPSEPAATSPPTTTLGSEAGASRGGLPWERREELGFLKAFFDTVSMVLTQPAAAFSAMKTSGDLAGPMLFALIGGSAGAIISILFQIAIGSITSRNDMFRVGVVGGCGYIVLAPVMILLGLFIWSGIMHLCLMILGGAAKPFETTFRVVCFSSGSTQLLAMIPFCGWMIAAVWNFVAQCIGLSRAHEIDTGKAVIAVLLPGILCCGGLLLCAMLMGGLGALNQFSHH